jgi:hypothetical protein
VVGEELSEEEERFSWLYEADVKTLQPVIYKMAIGIIWLAIGIDG